MLEDNSILDDKVRATLGTPPQPNFDAWKSRHGDALHHLNPVVTAMHDQRRRVLVRVAKFAIAASVAVVAFGWLLVSQERSFAQTIETINKAESISWSIDFYERRHSKDGKRSWLVASPKWERSYLAPDVYRDVRYNAQGVVTSVSVESRSKQKVLRLDMIKKTATIINEPSGQFGEGNPFGTVVQQLQKGSIEFIGEKVVDGIQVNAFRAQRKLPQGDLESYEIWLNTATKELVGFSVGDEEFFDPSTDPDRNNPAEEQISLGEIAGVISHNIKFNAELDPSLFSLTAPEGFKLLESPQKSKVTEDVLIQWLRLSALANDGMFIELENYSADLRWHNAIGKKEKADLSSAEKEYLALHNKLFREGNRMPVGEFIDEFVEPGSFRYLGKGTKLGDAARIVCFYKLKETGKYRAVYGDLRASDIDPAELPLPVQ